MESVKPPVQARLMEGIENKRLRIPSTALLRIQCVAQVVWRLSVLHTPHTRLQQHKL